MLTITTRHPVVSADNGTVSDTFRLLDWRESSRRASVSPQLYATLKLVDRLESAEKQRAATQRTRFTAARESWRCRNCRALWRPDDHERCPSCGRDRLGSRPPFRGRLVLIVLLLALAIAYAVYSTRFVDWVVSH